MSPPEWWTDGRDLIGGFRYDSSSACLVAIDAERYRESKWLDQRVMIRSMHRTKTELVDGVDVEFTPEANPEMVRATAAVIWSDTQVTMIMDRG
jgi:hypothetical protein